MYINTKWLFPAIICFVFFPLQAQDQNVIDSLRQSLATQTDTAKVNTLKLLSEEYVGINTDSALYYGNQLYDLSKELGYYLGQTEGLSKRGIALEYKGQYEQAVPLYQEALQIARDHDVIEAFNPTYTNLALVYKALGNFPKAQEYHFKALEISEQLQDSSDMAVSLNNIGNIYSFQKEYAEGLKYYLQAADILEKLDQKKFLSSILNNVGIVYSIQEKYDDALTYHQRSLRIKQEIGFKNGEAASLNNIGNLLRDQQKYQQALPYLHKALSIYQETKNVHKLPIIYRDLAEIYKHVDVEQAIHFATASLTQAKEINKKNDIKEAYLLLSELSALQKKYKQAYQYHQRFTSLKDSLFNETKSEQLAKLQTQYQSAKKEKAIAQLEEQKAQGTLRFILSSAVLGMVIMLGVFFIYRQRLKIQKNRQVYQAKEALTQAELENAHLKENELQQELEFKHKELTTHALNLVRKNGTMEKLKQNVNKLIKKNNGAVSQDLKSLKRLVDYSFRLDKDWEEFSRYFEQVHKDFFTNLLNEYPSLTTSECRLCALIKLNLTIKETATILGISPKSVKMARYRLRKKLGLCTEENLTEFIINFDKKSITLSSSYITTIILCCRL